MDGRTTTIDESGKYIPPEPDLSGYTIEDLRQMAFRQALKRCKGRVNCVANELGVHRDTIRNWKRLLCGNNRHCHHGDLD